MQQLQIPITIQNFYFANSSQWISQRNQGEALSDQGEWNLDEIFDNWIFFRSAKNMALFQKDCCLRDSRFHNLHRPEIWGIWIGSLTVLRSTIGLSYPIGSSLKSTYHILFFPRVVLYYIDDRNKTIFELRFEMALSKD
jgi:hypothetical protein